MTAKEQSALFTILERMPTGKEAAWDEGMARLYAIALRNVPGGVTEGLIEAILDRTDPWRPTAGEIKQMVLEKFAPRIPSPDEALEEVRYYIRRYGHNAKRLPGTNAYVAGDPEFSSPVIAAAVRSFGGWDKVCDNDDPSGVFEKHFKDAYTDRTYRQREKYMEMLVEPASFRRLMEQRQVQDQKRLEHSIPVAIPVRPALTAPVKPRKDEGTFRPARDRKALVANIGKSLV